MKGLFVSLVLCSIVVSNTALAEEPVMTPLVAQQPAPYAGVLLNPDAVARTVAEYETRQAEIDAAIVRAVGEKQAQCTYHENEVRVTLETDNKIAQAHIDSGRAQNDLLQKELKKAEARQSNPMLWSTIGVVTGVVLTVAIVWVVKK